MSVTSRARTKMPIAHGVLKLSIILIGIVLIAYANDAFSASDEIEPCEPGSASVTLAPGEKISEGVLCGHYIGDPDDPALINTMIAGESTLINVIIGKDASFLPSSQSWGLTLRNVRFVANDSIPAGVCLTHNLRQLDMPGVRRIDLSDSMLLSEDPLIEQLQRLVPQFALAQKANGNLRLSDGDLRVEVVPFDVCQYSTSTSLFPSAPGIHVMDEVGLVRIVTDLGRGVVASVIPADMEEMQQVLAPLDLVPRTPALYTPLVLENKNTGQELYAFYPDLFNESADEGRRPGITAMPHQNYSGHIQFLHVYEDEEGQFRQQIIFPGVYNWLHVKAFIYRKTGQSAVIQADGSVRLTLPSGKSLHAVPDHRLTQGTSPEGVRSAGDVNGDGTVDFILSHENRYRGEWIGTSIEQVLYVLPENDG